MIKETIIIPHSIHSRNILDRKHWAWKSSLKKEYQLLVRNQMKLSSMVKAKSSIRYHLEIKNYRKRLLDHDNLVGGAKGLIDALWYEGFIFDDSKKYIYTPRISQVKTSGEQYLEITRGIE